MGKFSSRLPTANTRMASRTHGNSCASIATDLVACCRLGPAHVRGISCACADGIGVARCRFFEQTPAVDIPADVPVSSAAPGIGTSEVGIAVGAFTLYPSIEKRVRQQRLRHRGADRGIALYAHQAGRRTQVRLAESFAARGGGRRFRLLLECNLPELLERLCSGGRAPRHPGGFLCYRPDRRAPSNGSPRRPMLWSQVRPPSPICSRSRLASISASTGFSTTPRSRPRYRYPTTASFP